MQLARHFFMMKALTASLVLLVSVLSIQEKQVNSGSGDEGGLYLELAVKFTCRDPSIPCIETSAMAYYHSGSGSSGETPPPTDSSGGML